MRHAFSAGVQQGVEDNRESCARGVRPGRSAVQLCANRDPAAESREGTSGGKKDFCERRWWSRLPGTDAWSGRRVSRRCVRPRPALPCGKALARPVELVPSHSPLAPAPVGALVERRSGAPADIVSQLAGRGIRHAYLDGGITLQGLLRAGQRLIVTRVPALIGSGTPLIPLSAR
jgi:hypothetical protein